MSELQRQEARFIANGDAVDLILGVVPSDIFAIEGLEETSPSMHYWFKSLADAGASGQYGLLVTGTDGIVTKHAAATNGFAAYDSNGVGLEIVAPDGDGFSIAAGGAIDYNAATTYTARSATVLGSVVRPTTHNGLVFECTTASGGGAGTEPTWPTQAGQSVTSGSGDVWLARPERTIATGGKGITFGATGQSDSDEWLVIASVSDRVRDYGNSALSNPLEAD